MKKVLIILITAIILISCDENSELMPISIKATFETPFPKREKNMIYKLGKEFSLKNNNDTVNFKVIFNKKNHFNYIINKKTNDTAFSGIVNKYRGLYYFNEQINDTTYWIYAVKIENGTITGLGTEWFQMIYLDEQLDEILNKKRKENEDLKLLIKTINKDTSIIKLIPQKKVMQTFYQSIIDSLPPDTIIDGFDYENYQELSGIKNYEIDTTLKETQKKGIIINLYPNPADEFITIEVEVDKANKDIFFIINIYGEVVMSGKIMEKEVKIDVSELSSGTYFISIPNENGNREIRKFIIK